MGRLLNVVNPLHRRTKRDYLPRMVDDKVACMAKAKEYGFDYWDGDRRYGYGGYVYDGRWERVARELIELHNLHDEATVLDVGCGKGYLLYEFQRLLPRAGLTGCDVSEYALAQAKDEVKGLLFRHDAAETLPYADNQFDLLVSLGALHNLPLPQLAKALAELDRVGKNKYLMVESYRNDQELFNLQCWALTCETFLSVDSWIWLFDQVGYSGDYEFIFFE